MITLAERRFPVRIRIGANVGCYGFRRSSPFSADRAEVCERLEWGQQAYNRVAPAAARRRLA